MATDATGTPTSLGIPKFNTAADAPSGLGGNAQMDSIDTLVAARVVKPSGIVSGEAAVWNGSSWDRSSVTRINADGSIKFNGYGTALPGSPYDGEVFTLVDSTTAPTYQWTFRYNAGSVSALKWEIVGGSTMSHEILATETTASTTYVDLATVGPTLTVPRAGDYEITFGVAGFPSVGAAQVFVAPKLGAAAASDSDDIRLDNSASTVISGARTIKRTLAASDVVKLQYRVNANTGNFLNRWLFIRPIRVS